jgi:hypothetical protein
MISELPVEIFTLIRKNLFSRSAAEDPFGFIEDIKLLNEVECRRNWRNFLSVSKKSAWSEIRKQCMIWCLHGYQSEKYLRDANFKIYLTARMRDPSSQLCLTISDTELLLSSNHFTQIFDIEMLHTLTLVHCFVLSNLGNMNSLKILNISDCENLVCVGEMKRLIHLRLKTDRNDLLQRFPLEKLRTLHVEGVRSFILEFTQNMSRFFNLLELSLHRHGYNEMDLPIIRLPSLVSLKLIGFHSFDLSGLINLKVLNYGDTPPENIKDQQNIICRLEKVYGCRDLCFNSSLHFPNLKLLECCPLENLNNWEKISNIRELYVHDTRGLTEKTLTFGANVRSLKIYLPHVGSINFLKFDKICKLCITCNYLTNNDLSLFSYINHLELVSLLNITDISSIKNVPVLGFCNCYSIENFSCLGSQRVLYVNNCTIFEKDIEELSRIPNLIIFSCVTLRKVTHLHSSNYLHISNCHNLTDISLRGSHYQNVRINWCSKLKTVNITRRVYFFSLFNCSSITSLVSDLKRHCDYFEHRVMAIYG